MGNTSMKGIDLQINVGANENGFMRFPFPVETANCEKEDNVEENKDVERNKEDGKWDI